jgi:fructose-bisphosphate aldolase class II
MGDDFINFITSSILHHPSYMALHLDHGHSLEICKQAVDLGFTSVMIDASALSFNDNIALTKSVADYAHARNVSVEAELGTLSGFEDENTHAEFGLEAFTNPESARQFVEAAGCDSLAIAIGTSHGAYKRSNDREELRFDILEEVSGLLPNFPLVLHGSSMVPQYLVDIINANGGKMEHAGGIPAEQIRRAIAGGICKVNIDSDARLAWTAAVRREMANDPAAFDPRKFLTAARDQMTKVYVDLIEIVMKD